MAAGSSNTSKILVIRLRCLGDIALLGSVFRNLKLHWPQSQISLLTAPPYVLVGALHSDLDRTYSLPPNLTKRLSLIQSLRSERFTHVLDFDNATTTTLITWLTGARVRVTYEREGQRLRRAWMYTLIAKIPARDFHTLHITEAYLSLLTAIDVPIRSRDCTLTPSAKDTARAKQLALCATSLSQSNLPRVLIHPGARSLARVWPPEYFAAVCDRLRSEFVADIVLVSGQNDRNTTQAICAAASLPLVVIDESLTIGEFAALCRHYDLMICNDSGPMHIAACMGTRVVALFGAQNSILWGPIGAEQRGHTILQASRPCPCIDDTPSPCIRADSDLTYCVRRISVEQVVEAVRNALKDATVNV